jgi:hypothetical protein
MQMSTQRFKLPLNAATFPLISSDAGRSVLVSSSDVSGPRNGRAFSGSDDATDYNIPSVLYAENVLPVHGGYKSISYKTVIPAHSPEVHDFDQIISLRDLDEKVVLYSPGKGQNYTYDKSSLVWEASPIYAGGWTVVPLSYDTLATATVSRAYADGKTFICYSNIKITDGTVEKDGSLFFWDTSLTVPALVLQDPQEVPLGTGKIAGLPDEIKGKISCVSSSNGYLLLASELTIYWGLYNGTQFNFAVTQDGEITGSGYKIPEDIKGPITAITPVAGGFIIWTNKNAIAASYSSSNFENPFIFREIANCGGVEDAEKIAVDQAASAPPQRIVAYTTGGLQFVTLNSAETTYPNVTDFLCGKKMERWDPVAKAPVQSITTLEFFTKLTFVGNRYLIISYGSFPGRYSFALLLDTALNRWGKFRLPHVDCFPFLYNNEQYPLTYGMMMDVSYTELGTLGYDDLYVQASGVTYPRQAVAFLLETGEVKLAVMDSTLQDPADTSTAILVIGRMQLSRASVLTLMNAEVDGMTSGTAHLVPSYDGRNFAAALPGVTLESNQDYRKFGWELATAKNFNLVLEGQFDLSALILEGMADGKF